jgi:hypothetical protein
VKPRNLFVFNLLVCQLWLLGCNPGSSPTIPSQKEETGKSPSISLDSQTLHPPPNATPPKAASDTAVLAEKQAPKQRKENFATSPNRVLDQKNRNLIRLIDSIATIPSGWKRLHPEDQAIFKGIRSRGKILLPILDKTGKPLPFPYAYPSRYGADIRRLDSLKKAQQADSTGRD